MTIGTVFAIIAALCGVALLLGFGTVAVVAGVGLICAAVAAVIE